jgi:transposase-like protein
MSKGTNPEKVVREIHRRTRRRFSAEEKIRIILEGLRGEDSIAELCRREGLAPNLYYRWSKEFLEAGKKRLLGDTTREATAPEVKTLREENQRLKQVLHPGVDAHDHDGGHRCRCDARSRAGEGGCRSGRGPPPAAPLERQRPRYVSGQLATYLATHGLTHTRGKPYHPMTQGKIERYHRSMKNVVKLEHYYSPWELERAIGRFVEHYNYRRLHEALQNVTPADVYYGRQAVILARRERIKRATLKRRKRMNQRAA